MFSVLKWIFRYFRVVWHVGLFSSKIFIVYRANENRYTSQSTLGGKIRSNAWNLYVFTGASKWTRTSFLSVLCKHYRADLPRHTNSSFLNNNSFRPNHGSIRNTRLHHQINQLKHSPLSSHAFPFHSDNLQKNTFEFFHLFFFHSNLWSLRRDGYFSFLSKIIFTRVCKYLTTD